MTARGVYRRRHFAQRRRVVPTTFAATRVVVRVRRAPQRRRRPYLRRRATVLGRAQVQATGSVSIRRRSLRIRARIQRRIRAILPSAPGRASQPAILGRTLKAIQRIRMAMRRRLRWRESPLPPAPLIGEESVLKGRICSPGLLRGRITEGGP